MNTVKNNELPKKILINGDFLCRRLTGIERYAYEITRRLDKISGAGEIAIVIPSFVKDIPAYRNLEIIRLEKKSKSNIRWQMLTLQGFLLTHRKYTILEFGNCCLPLAPGIVFLHDIYCEFFPEDFVSRRDKFTRLYSRLQYRLIACLAKKIVTVSEYSKNEISKTFNVDPSKINVIYSSADHIRDIDSDASIFEQFPMLAEKPFYFSLGSLSKRKNIKWILEYAVKHPETNFAISGTSLSTVKVDELTDGIPKNIIMLGYLDDSKVKALMTRCKAFILPSYYEGFGLTPLEALSRGTQIVIANAASLPEIYGNTAHYIDPFNTGVDLDKLLLEPVEKPDFLLSKYSYNKSAQQVYEIIKSIKLI
jgi:glycosyltransferase involved in cell wall biosynthesis